MQFCLLNPNLEFFFDLAHLNEPLQLVYTLRYRQKLEDKHKKARVSIFENHLRFFGENPHILEKMNVLLTNLILTLLIINNIRVNLL